MGPNISFHLDPTSVSVVELESQLVKLVEASGGQAGVLATWNPEAPGTIHSANCGLQTEASRVLTGIVSQVAQELSLGRYRDVGELQDLVECTGSRLGLNDLHALVMPVMVQGRSIGLFCLLHPDSVPEFVRHSPQVCSLSIDRLELVVRNARLVQHLFRERLWFETIVKESLDGITILDRDGLVVGINPAMESLSGWKISEVVGKPGHEVFPLAGLHTKPMPSSRRELTLYKQPSKSTLPISAEPLEAQLLDRHSQSIDVEVSGLTVRDETGQPDGWVMVLRDIRVRKETERLGKVFLSAMSHELQTPIAVISGFAGIISDPDIDLAPEVVREKASVILEESQRLQKMVKQMLEASSIQAGGITLSCESVSVEEVVGRVMRTLKSTAAQKKVKLLAKLGKHLPLLWADPDRLQQVLINLVDNAIKYGAGERVVIEAKSSGKQVVFCVMDRGKGVKASDKERIFGLFQRGSSTKVRGSGLGLFIAKTIVEAHGGNIGVTDGAEGGACFWFSIPQQMD